MISFTASTPPEGLALPALSPELVLVFICILVIGYSLGYLVSHGMRRLTRYLDDREELRRSQINNNNNQNNTP